MSEVEGQQRLWLVGGVGAVVLLLALGWLVVVSPELSTADARRASTEFAAQDNVLLQRSVTNLRAQSANIGTIRNQLALAQAALPSTPGYDTFTRQLAGAAKVSGVKLTSITMATPTAASGPAATGAQPGPQPGAPPGAQPGPVPHVVTAGVNSIEIVVVSSGPASAQQRFLHNVQYGPRAALVESVGLAPSVVHSADSPSTMTLSVRVFSRPPAPTQAPTQGPPQGPASK